MFLFLTLIFCRYNNDIPAEHAIVYQKRFLKLKKKLTIYMGFTHFLSSHKNVQKFIIAYYE